MSEIKALEKLRKSFDDCTTKAGIEPNEFDTVWITKDPAMKMLDEIQAEVDSRFIELPVDADGVPIHVGDVLECDANGYEGTFTVFAVGNNVAVGDHDIEWIMDNPTKWFHVASACHHIKPRMLEDVLSEYGRAYYAHMVDGYMNYDGTDEPLTSKYATEIRELLTGDAE